MAGRKCVKVTSKYLAKLAEKSAPCAFCKRSVDEETTYGKLYSIGDIHCHYFCVLLSCCLIQKGKDEEGLFGFMYPDILAEVERSKKHRCSYCGVEGASLGCSVTQCKKQFHLPCGREKRAVSLFYGNYKSYCEKHAPKQKIPDLIMSKAKARLSGIRKRNQDKSMHKLKRLKDNKDKSKKTESAEEAECVCVICYEAVQGFPTTETFWPPCCARDAWFHRSCLQRMALSAGMYYLKCPLCNDKQTFSNAVLEQGYFIPDRDAAWELEQNAFAEIYERPAECRAEECKCAKGRDFDANSGIWDIKLCVLCGGPGAHAACLNTELYVCGVCSPAAPDRALLAALDAVSLPSQEQSTQRAASGPIMPSRMSLRRTKQRHTLYTPSSSSQNIQIKTEAEISAVKSNTDLSREDLNLKTPRRPPATTPTEEKQLDNPLKQGSSETVTSTEQKLQENPLKQESNETVTTSKQLKNPLKQESNETVITSKQLKNPLKQESNETVTTSKQLKNPLKQESNETVATSKQLKNPLKQGSNETSPIKLLIQPENELLSPLKLLKQGLHDNISPDEVESIILDRKILDQMKERFRKPKPACVKRRIVGEILEGLLDYVTNEQNIKEWKNSREKLKETTSENKENISDTPTKNSSNVQNEDLYSKHGTFKSPEHILGSSEGNIAEPLEENILQPNVLEQLLICGNTNLIPKKSEISDIKNEKMSLLPDISKTPILESSENNIAEPLEENILQPSILEKLIVCENTNLILEKSNISDFELSQKHDISKTPKHIGEISEQNRSLSNHKISEPLEENILQLSTLEKLIICENANLTPKKPEIIEENSSNSSSSSTPFQLPPEFIAESSNSLPIIETPKKLKKINIENDSMEISENNQIVNIDLVKVENNASKDFKMADKKNALKLSPLNKGILEKTLDIDLESFKNHYLNEVDRKFNCKFEHNHNDSEKIPTKLKTAIDFAMDSLKKPPKRKLPADDNVASKRRKTSKIVKNKRQYDGGNNYDDCNKNQIVEESDSKKVSDEIRKYRKRRDHNDKTTDKSDSTKRNVEERKHKKLKYKKNHKTELSIRNRNINLKIRFKSEELDLKISKPKKRGRRIKKETPKVMKQYVLQYPMTKKSPTDCIVRPDTDVTPLKKKYNMKSEKPSDNLKQTSISNFFKISPKA